MDKIIKAIGSVIFSLLAKKFDLSGADAEEKIPTGTLSEDQSFYMYLKNLYLAHGAQWESINIFGIRDTTDMAKDIFNDYIGIAIDNAVHLFKATCDPAVYWTKQGGAGSGNKGVAHICLGYHKGVYMVGTHKTYEALVQKGAPIKIWRDSNHNFKKDAQETIESGYFGVNIHRASAYSVVQKIGKYSAGCQVIQAPQDFTTFLQIVKNSDKYKKKGKRATFSYFLFQKNEIPATYMV